MTRSPPTHTVLHRAKRRGRRRRRRRRRLSALGAGGALAALLVLAVGSLGVVADLDGHGRPASPAHANTARRHLHPRRAPTNRQPSAAVASTEAAGDARIRRLVRLGLPIYCAGPHGNAVAFTFDDGPGPYTNLALRKLTQARERATFFVVGRSMDYYPGYLSRELKVATIGDHTYTHPLLTALSPAAITSEIQRTKQKIESDSGRPVDLFRPPYGAHDAIVDRIIRRLGLLEIMWSVDSADSLGANYAGIIKNVESGLRPGEIILMHENRGQTIRALSALLPELHRRHLRSVSLPELFATDPPSQMQVRQGLAGCGLAGRSRTGAASG